MFIPRARLPGDLQLFSREIDPCFLRRSFITESSLLPMGNRKVPQYSVSLFLSHGRPRSVSQLSLIDAVRVCGLASLARSYSRSMVSLLSRSALPDMSRLPFRGRLIGRTSNDHVSVSLTSGRSLISPFPPGSPHGLQILQIRFLTAVRLPGLLEFFPTYLLFGA